MGLRNLLDKTITGSGLAQLALATSRNRLRILCYHGIWTAPGPHFGDKLFMSPEKFASRLALIRSLGLNVMPMREAVQALRERRLPPKATAITIDDGWSTSFSHMLPLLERYGFPATVYVQTERIDARAPVADVALRYALEHTRVDTLLLDDLPAHGMVEALALVLRTEQDKGAAFDVLERMFAALPVHEHRHLLAEVFARLGIDPAPFARCKAFDLCDESALVEADRKGFEIALHTHTHGLGDFSAEKVATEIAQNRASLARILGRPAEAFRHFCWPSGDYTAQAITHLRVTDIDMATSCDLDLARANSDPLALPRILDGQTTSDEAFLVAMGGLQNWIDRFGSLVRRH